MEWYLNIIPLGENCKGVQSASRVYFGQGRQGPEPGECASLIGITNNPSRYDPYISEANTRENKERQEVILTQMLKQGYINQEQHDEAVAEKLVFTNSSRDNSDTSDDYYSWFEDQVIRDVVSDLCDKTGYEYDIVYKMGHDRRLPDLLHGQPRGAGGGRRGLRRPAEPARPRRAPSSCSPAS